MNKPLVYGVAAAAGLGLFFLFRRNANASQNNSGSARSTAVTNGIASGNVGEPKPTTGFGAIGEKVAIEIKRQDNLDKAMYGDGGKAAYTASRSSEPTAPAPVVGRYLNSVLNAVTPQLEVARTKAANEQADRIRSESALAAAEVAYKNFSFEG